MWRVRAKYLIHKLNYQFARHTIESLNSVIRKAIKKRKLFPTDDSAKKVIYLAIQAAAKKWTMPIRNWKLALNRFMIEFEDRLADYIQPWQLHRIICKVESIYIILTMIKLECCLASPRANSAR